MTPGDLLAFTGMALVLGALTVIAVRDWRAQRRAQRHLEDVLGHHTLRERARLDGRLREDAP